MFGFRFRLGLSALLMRVLKSPVTLAWLAIVISFSQLLVSFPLLSSFYSSPKLTIEGTTTSVHDSMSMGNFTIVNAGRSPATNVEIGFTTRIGDRVSVMPAIAHKVETDKDPIFFDHTRLEFARVLPGEIIIVMIIGKGEEPLNKHFVGMYDNIPFKNFPSVSYLRSDQGAGLVIQKLSEGSSDSLAKTSKASEELDLKPNK